MSKIADDAVKDTQDDSEKRDIEDIKKSVDKTVDLLGEIDDLKEDIKAIARGVQSTHSITTKRFNKMAKIAYKASIEEERLESDEFFELYDKVVK